jgi:23S rRNA pseudouridine1911/1915/1917 synthase
VNGEPRVVHLDEFLAVIDKPAGLVVHPAPSHHGPTLVDLLGEILAGGADPERPGIVHRLDKGTSGLLVVARDDGTHAALQELVRERRVERAYLALAGGRLASRTGTIDAPIGRASRQRHRMAVSGAASRQARTHFEVIELLGAETYLEAKLETGRTHQIRVHMAHIGHPLLGDMTYGAGHKSSERKLGSEAQAQLDALGRQALHAAELKFEHPVTGKRLAFESELPDDMANVVAALRRDRGQ